MGDMAKYLILIYGDEQQWSTMSAAEQQRIDDGHVVFTSRAGGAVADGGAIIDGGALEPTSTATSLRAGAGASASAGPTVTDGPFLETKEALGGFYLIEAADLDEAISLAARLPEVAAAHSGVEIRPLRPAG
jgi:hypothetical protein